MRVGLQLLPSPSSQHHHKTLYTLRPILFSRSPLSFPGSCLAIFLQDCPGSHLPGLLAFLLTHHNLFSPHCQSDTADLPCSTALQGSVLPLELSQAHHPGFQSPSRTALKPLALSPCRPAMQVPSWSPGHAPYFPHLGLPSVSSTPTPSPNPSGLSRAGLSTISPWSLP